MKRQILVSMLLAGLLAACGEKAPAPAPAPAPTPAPAPAAAPAPPPAPDPALARGEEIFKKTCVLCHKTGEAGAPKLGNKEEWAARIAQGNDALYTHAINGFTGQKGAMPPKGGSASLSDDEVKAAVDYMVAQAK